jgi:large subunit ribosomal protein L18e
MGTGPTNINLQNLVHLLKKTSIEHKVALWKRVALDLEMPTRIRRNVNLYKISKYTKAGETIVVPGKVLSLGELDKKITIAAFRFSKLAKDKIKKAGGSSVSISELVQKNPKGSKVRILG